MDRKQEMSGRKIPSPSQRALALRWPWRLWPPPNVPPNNVPPWEQWNVPPWEQNVPEVQKIQKLKDYQEALKLGEVLVAYARVMMIGPGGVGKSSLLRGLMNRKLLRDGDSTVLADTKTVKRQFWAKAGEFADSYWADVTDQDEIQELVGLFQLVIQAQSGHSSLSHAAVKLYPPAFKSQSIELISDEFVSNVDSVVQSVLKQAVERQVMQGNPVVAQSEVLMHVWDCGGQTVFLDVLPAFVSSRTMFLLFFDARQDLLGKCKTLSYKKGKVLSTSEHSFTVLHVLCQWMASIHAMCTKKSEEVYIDPNVLSTTSENESPTTHRKKATFDDDEGPQNSATIHPSLQMKAHCPPEHDAVNTIPKFPRIIPVGTHGDAVLGKERAEVLKTLMSHCEDKAYTHLLLEGVIVDNTTAGCGERVEDKGFKYIREMVHQLASKQLAIRTPVAWVLFRKVLKKVAEVEGHPIVSYQQAVAVGKVCAISEDVVPSVLHFYHELGVFLHYTEIESLSQCVIADPQWLIKQLGRLLAPQGFQQKISNPLLWKPLQEKGILVQSLYEAVWEESNLPPQSLADLLEHFQLAAPISIKPPATVSSLEGRKYFIPCVLQFCPQTAKCTTKFQECVKKKISSPLHLRFSTRYVPPGFFTRLATALIRDSKCELLFDRGIYRDKMTFAYGEIDEFTIHEHTSSVQITVVRTYYRQPHIPTFYSVCCDILKLIQACFATIRQWLPLVDVEVTFFCEQCLVKDHFIPIRAGSTTISVLRCQAGQRWRPTKEQQYWLKIPNTPEGDLSDVELQGVADDVQRSGMLNDLACALEVVPLLEVLEGDPNTSLTLLQRWRSGVESSLLAHSLLVHHLRWIGLEKTSNKLYYREFIGQNQGGSPITLTVKDLYELTHTLRAAAPQWRMIGGTLGILDSDLTIIQHTPLLVQEGPLAFFREMLTQWLKWAPPNHSVPTVETLAFALQKNGHEALAANLRSLFLQKKGVSHFPQHQNRPLSQHGQSVPASNMQPTIDKVALEKALQKERMMPLCIAQCMTVGAPQTGKSSLKRRLLKQADGRNMSTGVADKPVVTAVTADGTEWTVLDWEDEGARFMQTIKQPPSKIQIELPPIDIPGISEQTKVLQDKHFPREVPQTKKPVQETAMSVGVDTDSVLQQCSSSSSNSTVTESGMDQKEPEPPCTTYSDLIDKILDVDNEKWIAAKKHLENQCTIYFTDTGGQLEFQEVLPVIISGPSIFLLVFNLKHAAKGLHEEFPAVYKRGDGHVYEPPPGISTFTTKDLILHILASIQSTRSYHFQKEGNDRVIEAKVLLVGTHSDHVTDINVRNQIECDVQKLLKDTPYYQDGMLQVPCRKQSNERFVYMVNNEAIDDPVFQEIREKIGSLIFKRPRDSDYKEDISAHWLAFDLMLRMPGKSKILTYQHCAALANRCGIKEEDVEKALTFLHERFGIIRYFKGEGLGNIVITNPQVIYNLLSDLIAEQFNDGNSDCRLTPKQVNEFRNKGLISADALKCITSQRHEASDLLAFLLSVLSCLHILVKLEGDEENPETKYFMPCVLAGTIPDLSTSEECSEPNVADLLIVFDCGQQYCPKGLFSVLAIKLARKFKQQEYKWVLNREKMGRQRVVFQIYVECSSYTYTALCTYTVHIQHGLVGSRSVLRIFLEKFPNRKCLQLCPKNLGRVCKEICDSVKSVIKSSLEELHKRMKFSIGFYSTCGENKASQKSHIAIVHIKDLFQQTSCVPQDMICIDCGNDVYPLNEEHKVWFTEVPQVLDSRSQATTHAAITQQRGQVGRATPKLVEANTSQHCTKPSLSELLKFRCTDGREVSIPVEIATKYVQFSTFLLDDRNGSRAEIMAHKHHYDSERINTEILQEWLTGRGKQPVTWATLVDVLHDSEFFTLAGDISTVKCNPSEQRTACTEMHEQIP